MQRTLRKEKKKVIYHLVMTLIPMQTMSVKKKDTVQKGVILVMIWKLRKKLFKNQVEIHHDMERK